MKRREFISFKFKRTSLLFCLLISFISVHVLAQPKYENPIVPGFNPDPSICRVGEHYYLVTSTFEYFPGVPVYHSRDLVNWEIIGHALDRPSQLNLDSIACSGGIYAPTIRYHDGTFYMITTLIGQKNMPQHRNFIVTTKDPAGPWSEPHWIEEAPGIDPSLFFDDDGKVYYSGNRSPEIKIFDKHRNIWVQELNINTWKLVGKKVDVLDGGEYYEKGTIGSVSNYEASHLYKKDGKYYMLIAHGGTSQNHAVSIWKSDNIFGPYEINPANPILTHCDLSKELYFTSTGHADLVQTQNDEWWIVYLAKRPYGGENHIMGRETFMSPVDWSGTWPVVNPTGLTGRGELIHPKPNLPEHKVVAVNPRDEFKFNTLNKYWTFIRTPRSEWWSLTKRKDFLRIDLRPEKISDQANPSFIGKRQEHQSFTATTKMEFTPESINEEAGLVVERDKDFYLKFTLGIDNGKYILSLSQKYGVQIADSLIAKSEIDSTSLFLEVCSKEYLYTFRYSYNGKDWIILKTGVDGRLLGLASAGRFTGTFIGMYASSNGTDSKNFADFDWFEYTGVRKDVQKLHRLTDTSSRMQMGQPIFIDLIQLEQHHKLYLQQNQKSKIHLNKFLLSSEKLLDMKPLSVMDKSVIPPSGDKHDFMSIGPYWWPDSNKPDGLPYIRRDGERNPEYHKITDESFLTRTIGAVDTLAISFYITKDVRFAQKAAELLRVWFLNPETKMNPNMKHSQSIPGINTGRGIGLIETRYLYKIVDAILLLRTSDAWEKDDDNKIKQWFEHYFNWITTHQYGIDESNEKNNHGTWFDVQVSAIAIFLYKEDYAKIIIEKAKDKRIDAQIEEDGKQPLELARTRSWNYSTMNLSAFMHLALLGEYVGVDLWNYQSQAGGSIRKALDFLLPFSVNQGEWSFKLIEEINIESLIPMLRMAQKKYDEKLYSDWIKKIFGNKPPTISIGQRL